MNQLAANKASYIPHDLVFCFANDLSKINPFDSAVNDRINVISYHKRFVDEPTNEFKLKKPIIKELPSPIVFPKVILSKPVPKSTYSLSSI